MQSYLKAVVGALIAGLGSLYQALDNGSITAQEWVATAIATLAALGVVWGVPNLDPAGKRQEASVQPAEGGPRMWRKDRGAVDVVTVLVVVVLVVLVLILFGFLR